MIVVSIVTTAPKLIFIPFPKVIGAWLKILGNDLVFGVNTFIKRFSKNKLTPIAVIKFEILGEFLSGLYAILSAKQPISAQIIIAGITVAQIGKPNDVNNGIEKSDV